MTDEVNLKMLIIIKVSAHINAEQILDQVRSFVNNVPQVSVTQLKLNHQQITKFETCDTCEHEQSLRTASNSPKE